MSDFDGELNKSLDDFMESYKITDTEKIYSNGMELVPIFRIKQWEEYNNQDKEIERLHSIIKEVREFIKEKYDFILEDDTFLDHDERIDRKQITHILEILNKGDK